MMENLEALIPKTEKRSLRYDFTITEIQKHAMSLAMKNKELVSIEEEKKAVTSQFSAKVNETKATINKLSGYVSDGFEFRDVECEIQYHKPSQGKKTIIRLDTNKTTAVESMSDYEFNLFNQPEDNETSDLLEAEREKLRGNGAKKGRGKKKKN
jgi:hypothetical protein